MGENALHKWIITNNPLVRDKLNESIDVDYRPCSYLELLQAARDEIHEGAVLLTHPLSGSVKPGETPYKSIMLAGGKRSFSGTRAGSSKALKTDFASVELIESAVETCQKFLQHARWPEPEKLSEQVHRDFQVVDYTLIISAFPSAGISRD